MANAQQSDKAFRFSIRSALIGFGFIAILLAAGRYTIRTYNSAIQSLESFSVIWLTHDMLVIHMVRNGGQWPSDWGALNPVFTAANGGYGAPDLAWVKERITIDFEVDPTTLSATKHSRDHQLHAIRMADGTENGETRAANARLKSAILNWTSRETITQDGT